MDFIRVFRKCIFHVSSITAVSLTYPSTRRNESDQEFVIAVVQTKFDLLYIIFVISIYSFIVV